MSESISQSRKVLHLVVEGFPAEREKELAAAADPGQGTSEIFHLKETNAREALEKIFLNDTVMVWGKV